MGFRIFRVQGLRRTSASEFRQLGEWVGKGLGFRVLGFRVQGFSRLVAEWASSLSHSGFRVQGLGSRVSGWFWGLGSQAVLQPMAPNHKP